MRRIIKWMFEIPQGDRTNLSIILWWEKRRIAYNAIIGIFGFCSLMLFFFFIELSGKLSSGEDAVEPLALFVAPILINLCYSAGWIVELAAKLIGPNRNIILGPQLMKLGIGFSLFVTLLPSVIWGIELLLLRLHIIN